MKTSIETINGKLCTVIRRPFDETEARKLINMYCYPMIENRRFTKGYERTVIVGENSMDTLLYHDLGGNRS